jgi:Tol biopolymer transport system component
VRTILFSRVAATLSLPLLLACHSDSAGPSLAADARPSFSISSAEWSAPVNMGPVINTAAGEMNAALSPDELGLYFTSDRAGGYGVTDIWVAHRDCVTCEWQNPVNLGAAFNGAGQDAGPRLSNDGHLLFFQTDRGRSAGIFDLWVARRDNPNDDSGWGTPVRLGEDVNSPTGSQQAAFYLQSAEEGSGNLYFNRATLDVPQPQIYYASISRDGESRGPAVLVPELNDLAANDQHVTISKNAKELFFSSDRAGGFGGFDVYTSTRQNANEPWSAPVNLGPSVNAASRDQQPSLSANARTLIFASNRAGGYGATDLYMMTRSPGEH